MDELAAGPRQPVDLLVHVDGHADGAALVGDGAGDRLANPPGGIGAELVAAVIVELLDGADQTDVAFLDQVEERHAATDVLLGDADHQAGVRLDEVLLRCLTIFDGAQQAIAFVRVIDALGQPQPRILPCSIRFARDTSSSAVSSGTRPISLR